MKLALVSTLAIASVLTGCSILYCADGFLHSTVFFNAPRAQQYPPCRCIAAARSRWASKPTAVTLQTNRAYLQDHQANAGTGFGQSLLVAPIHDAYVATSKPDLVVEWIQASLQRQFGSVTVYPDMQSLRAEKPSTWSPLSTSAAN